MSPEYESVLILVLWMLFSLQFFEHVQARAWAIVAVVAAVSAGGIVHWFVFIDDTDPDRLQTGVLVLILVQFAVLWPSRLALRVLHAYQRRWHGARPGPPPSAAANSERAFFLYNLFSAVLWWIFSLISGIPLFVAINTVNIAVQFADYLVANLDRP